jgi:putative spermidine/putrescine transport system permease protein
MMLRAFAYLVAAILLAPLVAIMATSFTTLPYVSFPPVGFTWRWYGEAFSKLEFLQSLYLSVQIALPATLITTALGLPAAIGIVRYRFVGRELVNAIVLSPLVLPPVVIGIAMLQFYNQLSVGATFVGLIFGHVVITLPYAVRLIAAGITGLDPNAERAAQSLGASPVAAFYYVTLPVVFPAVLAGAVFAFITSFDDVSISLFLATPRMVTLPVRIFAFWDQPIVPWLIAICSIIIVWTVFLIALIERAVSINGLFGYGDSRSSRAA